MRTVILVVARQVHSRNDASFLLDLRVVPQGPPPMIDATLFGRQLFAGLYGKGVERLGVWGEETGGKPGLAETRITGGISTAFWITSCGKLTC